MAANPTAPKQLKRYKPPDLKKLLKNRPGQWSYGLFNQKHATRYAQFLSQFEVIESSMPFRLAQLMGLNDDKQIQAAGYVYRTLRNPSIRLEVMRTLLHKAPHNKNKPDSWDYMLSEYSVVRNTRNDYAHGLWFTNDIDSTVLLAKSDPHGFAFMEAEPISTDVMDEALQRLRRLMLTVIVPENQMPPMPPQDTPQQRHAPKQSSRAHPRKDS
ncbi:MAG: hypothetical protein AB7O43_10015 [Hyphomicrobiaceae bacterium]